MNRRRSSFLLMVLLFSMVASLAQPSTDRSSEIGNAVEEEFKIVFRNKAIGSYQVGKVIKGDTTFYRASSETKVSFIGRVSIRYELTAKFSNGVLIKSSVSSYRNGSLRSSTTTTLKDSHYELVKDGEKSKVDRSRIEKSVVQLYFDPPVDGEWVYSEQKGELLQVSKMNDAEYQLGSKKPSVFIYTQNQISGVDVSFELGNYKIIKE